MPIPVLIVDDSSMSRKLILRALPPEWDVEIRQAANGLEALEACRTSRVELMFLDLTMPLMDGYETLKRLRQEGLDPTVIVISADIQPKAQEAVLALGAATMIKKPVTPEKIRAVLEEQGLL